MAHNIWGPMSDPQIQEIIPLAKKGAHHLAGLTTATHQPASMTTKIEVFPPAAQLMITDQMLLQHSQHMDQKTLIANIARHIAHQVGNMVEQQILKAYGMSASEAMKVVAEAKMAFLESEHALWYPHDKWDSIFSLPSMEPTPQATEPLTLNSLKDWLGAINETKKSYKYDYQQYVNDAAYAKPPGVYIEPEEEEAKAQENEIVKVFHDLIPGFAQMRDKCPEPECGAESWLQNVIIHLNDYHKWTREAIADWLETLDHDLTLKTPEEVKNAEHTH